MEITNRDDLRAGDVATFTYDDREFTGTIHEGGAHCLVIGPIPLRYVGGTWVDDYAFVRATREMPPLPTEPGAVILVTEVCGISMDEPVAALLKDGRWTALVAPYWQFSTEEITAWTPAKVVPA